MSGIFEYVEPWLVAMLLAAAMVAAWGIGWWFGHRQRAEPSAAAESKSADAAMALLALLLAFTFAMALSKNDQRRAAVLADSNSIGDFYTCATLLAEPARTKLQKIVRDYLQLRVDFGKTQVHGAALERALERFDDMHTQMTDIVAGAIPATPIAIPLTNTLNNLTSNYAARLHAYRDRLPWSILVLLFIAATVSMLLLGQHQGAAGRPQLLGILSFSLVVSLLVLVTLDLNQPGRGMIVVSQEPLERLLASIVKGT